MSGDKFEGGRSDKKKAKDERMKASLGELFGDVTRNLSTLMRQEVELAKAELAESAKKAGTGAGLFAGAGYAGLMAVLFLSITLWWGLGEAIDSHTGSAAIVAGIWALIALILFLVGRGQLKGVKGAPETVDSLKKIPETLKPEPMNTGTSTSTSSGSGFSR